MQKVEDRLLKYVSFWTTSDEESETTPSTGRQLVLAKELEHEMKELGLKKVCLSKNGYVYGCLTATEGMEDWLPVGFIAHMDTAPDFSGENVKPQKIENYDGKDILLKKAGTYIRVADFPTLKSLKGRTLITTDGTTLLGADDKAGIAEIMAAVEKLQEEKTPHGEIWIAFTPDEEIGKGSDHFDLDYFKAKYAYTLDGDYEGEVAYENFNAAGADVTFHGVNVHPGEAKDIMVNAILVANEFIANLPKEETPEHTEGREGFFHVTDIRGDVAKTELSLIIRDHDEKKFLSRLKKLEDIMQALNHKYHSDTVELSISQSYKNMLSVIEKHKDIVENANAAIRAAGLTPISRPVRGGTDGASLSFKGLPCPNLGTGGYGFHGPMEHISVEGMQTAVQVILYLATHPLSK